MWGGAVVVVVARVGIATAVVAGTGLVLSAVTEAAVMRFRFGPRERDVCGNGTRAAWPELELWVGTGGH